MCLNVSSPQLTDGHLIYAQQGPRKEEPFLELELTGGEKEISTYQSMEIESRVIYRPLILYVERL